MAFHRIRNHAQLCSDKDLYLGKLRLIQEPSQIVAFSPPFYLAVIEDEVGQSGDDRRPRRRLPRRSRRRRRGGARRPRHPVT